MVDGYEFAPGWVEDNIPVLTFTTPERERGHLSMPLASALCAFFLERHGPKFDLIAHLHRQRDFIFKTFGPGLRTEGLVDHIHKELEEIRRDPTDHREWIDVIILGFDGLLRTGIDPAQAVAEIVAKQTENEGRVWPDWRTVDPNKAIEHDRSKDVSAPVMTQPMRDFPTAVALSAIAGWMVADDFSQVHECMTYMAGQEIWTHQLPRVRSEAQAWALANRPDLAPVIEEAKTITGDNWREVLAVWLERYGPTIALPVLNADQHQNIDPLSELVEKIDMNKIVVADVGGAA